jgi:spore germination protein
MFGIKRRRTLIRLLSFTIAAFVVAISMAIASSLVAYSYRMSIEYSYQRALSELTVHVNSIDLTLQKGIYAGTPTQLVGLSAQLWRDSGAAKTDLSQIPLQDTKLDSTYKFISQVGDYANSLSKNVAYNQKITDDDRKNMNLLSGFAKKLSQQLSIMMDDLQAGKLSIFTANYAIKNNINKQPQDQLTVDAGFKNIENGFTEIPSLIYDGPFSDNILKKSATLTQGMIDVGRAKAHTIAAAFINVDEKQLKDGGDTGGNLPTYNFSTDTINIGVSKSGGYVVRMLDGGDVGAATISTADSIKKAREFLNKIRIGSMKESYNQTNNNICVINFCYLQGDVTIYTDLVKVGVSMDDGHIMSFDATGYIMNHKSRTLAQPTQSIEDLKKLLSPVLKVEKVSLVVVPGQNLSELLCYEFKCKGQNNQDVLDYFNAQTGREEKILILLQTPGGVLSA